MMNLKMRVALAQLVDIILSIILGIVIYYCYTILLHTKLSFENSVLLVFATGPFIYFVILNNILIGILNGRIGMYFLRVSFKNPNRRKKFFFCNNISLVCCINPTFNHLSLTSHYCILYFIKI